LEDVGTLQLAAGLFIGFESKNGEMVGNFGVTEWWSVGPFACYREESLLEG
jgi:hypothetical protein